MKTYILMDEKLNKTRAPPGLMEGINANMEFYDYWPEPEGGDVWSQPGDARCGLWKSKVQGRPMVVVGRSVSRSHRNDRASLNAGLSLRGLACGASLEMPGAGPYRIPKVT